MTKKNIKKSSKKADNKRIKNKAYINWYETREFKGILIVAILVLISASIYLKNSTGFLGSIVGISVFRFFGIISYFLPILLIFSFFAIFSGRFVGKLKSNTIMIGFLLLSISIFLGALYYLNSDFISNIINVIDEKNIYTGPGILGISIAFVLIKIIGKVGVIVSFIIYLIFFGIHITDTTISEFVLFISNKISSLFKLKIIDKKHIDNNDNLDIYDDDKEYKDILDIENTEDYHKDYLSLSNDFDDENYILSDVDKDESIEVKDYQNNKLHDSFSDSEDSYVLDKNELNDEDEFMSDYNRIKKSRINIDDPYLSFNPSNTFVQKINKYAEEITHTDLADDEIIKNIENNSQSDFEKFVSNNTSNGNYDSKSIENNFVNKRTAQNNTNKKYVFPSINLLNKPNNSKSSNGEELKTTARIIEKTLSDFNIDAKVISIQRGPTVTRYELKPPAGVKVSKIVNLANDLALATASADVRIEAPIPGKPYVGIEVPNTTKDSVMLREIIDSQSFKNSKSILPIALGKSISGNSIVTGISDMPHLLVAGATGAGKSVCINTMLISMLYKYSPEDLKMILVDPKVVELSMYEGIPHLLIPVVTDPKKASKALLSAVKEMERRYQVFSNTHVKDIKSYNKKCDDSNEKLPYMLIVVDELADLMMTVGNEVEAHICRLAQMGRACGIHLIIATQRPSVDVITGTIKANIPSRISFQVSSAIDSRTILDTTGAEKLLGRGDMLYYNPKERPKPFRIQGAFVSEDEVYNIVDFLKDTSGSNYNEELMQNIENLVNDEFSSDQDEDYDELMPSILEYISSEDTISISAIQRRFKVGYARAGRIVDQLEAMGAVTPQNGSKPRQVLYRQNHDKNMYRSNIEE